MEQEQAIGEALRELLGIDGDADPTAAYSRLWTQPGVCPLAPADAVVTLAYAEGATVLRDARQFAQWPSAGLFPAHPEDPDPAHDAERRRRARQRLYEALAVPRRANELQPRMERIAATLVAELPASRADLVSAFASPFTVAVMGEFMGLPSPAWPNYWARWLAEHRPYGKHPRISVGPYTDRIRQRPLRAAQEELNQAILAQLHGEASPGSVLDTLGEAVIDGDLTEADVLCIVPALSHTVISMTSLIAAVTRRLLIAPDLARAAIAAPSTLTQVIEETLRLEPPVAAVLRSAEHATSIGNERIGAGEAVVVHIAASNRDPARFAHPNRLDPDRPRSSCRHLSFGAGPNSCVGAPLARRAALAGVAALLPRLPRMQLTDERLPSWPHPFNPGLQRLYVEVD